MIILDTHIWVWWTDQNSLLTADYENIIKEHQADGLGVSVFSCWEVAKLVEKNRIVFSVSLEDWLTQAVARPNIHLLPLSPQTLAESITLPDNFHKDPADQIIVATARVYNCPLITFDEKILNYPHVTHLP
jgi:PIN domain nuclease of toxin-antitoxin system